SQLVGGVRSVVAELDKIIDVRTEREPFEDQPRAVYAEESQIFGVSRGRDDPGRRDRGIILRVADRVIGRIKAAVSVPWLDPDPDLEFELVLELRVQAPVVAE